MEVEKVCGCEKFVYPYLVDREDRLLAPVFADSVSGHKTTELTAYVENNINNKDNNFLEVKDLLFPISFEKGHTAHL